MLHLIKMRAEATVEEADERGNQLRRTRNRSCFGYLFAVAICANLALVVEGRPKMAEVQHRERVLAANQGSPDLPHPNHRWLRGGYCSLPDKRHHG